MRRACFVVSALVFVMAYAACVGDDATPLGVGAVDAGSGQETSSLLDAGNPGSDGAVDAGSAADAADAADPCAVPPSGAGVACTPSLTCPKGQNCCASAVNGQRDCVSVVTGCAGASIAMQCAARAHCADGNEICCLEATPVGTAPSGMCPATVNALGTACALPTTDAGCNAGQLRLCSPTETCPAGTSCKQIDIAVGTGTPYRTGACMM